jgi:dTDP-4-amino-4,6-dideoxygalactose transaminase
MRTVFPFSFDLTDEEVESFMQGAAGILRSGQLILGDHTREFERSFASFVNVKHAISVNSGSSALEILLRMKKVEGRVVLVPTNTNFATVAMVLRAGGIVKYLDMDEGTFAPTLDMVKEAIALDSNLAGVLWVHIGGVISPEFPLVVEYCRRSGLFVLEDSAHAHGSKVQGVMSGNLADGAAFSFFPTKVMTTFEGGMITTNDDQEDYLARSFRNQGKRGMDFGGLHNDMGNSWRITEMGALLGKIQLKKLPDNLESNYKLIVLVPKRFEVKDVIAALKSDGVNPGGGVYEIPCHRQPVFEGICPEGSYPIADTWCPRHICPPLTAAMSVEEANFVGEALVRYMSG